MSDSPKVTVLMPVYNSAGYLREAMDSMLAQTFRDFELLIMDNASSDGSAAIVASYTDPRIRYVRNESNLGLPASLNRGLRLARGSYIARMDADDTSRPDRLARQVDFLDRHHEVGICGAQILKHMGGRRYRVRYPQTHEEIRATTLFFSPFPHPAVMWRRSLTMERNWFYDESMKAYEDHELWSRMVEGTRTANLPEVLLDYRCHPEQLSGHYSADFLNLRINVFRRVVGGLVPGVTDDDLAWHVRITSYSEPFDPESLRRAERWMLRLLEANAARGIYQDAMIRRVFRQRWIMICGQAAYLGLQAFQIYQRSALAGGWRLDRETFKLLGKCLLKKRYA